MIICVLLVPILLSFVTADFYSSRYDNFDVQPLIENDRILLSYTKCFLDQGPCTPDAKDFKSKYLHDIYDLSVIDFRVGTLEPCNNL